MWEAERDNSWPPESADSSLAFAASEIATWNKVFSTVSAMLTMRVERQNSQSGSRDEPLGGPREFSAFAIDERYNICGTTSERSYSAPVVSVCHYPRRRTLRQQNAPYAVMVKATAQHTCPRPKTDDPLMLQGIYFAAIATALLTWIDGTRVREGIVLLVPACTCVWVV